MATFQFNTVEYPQGKDNTQKRQVFVGTASIQPDTPGGGTSTYVQGGIRASWVPLQPVKTPNPMPVWVSLTSLASHNIYIWSPGAVVSSIAVASNTLTVTANNNFQVGDQVKLTGLTGAAAPLNNLTVTVKTATATNFTAYLGVANVTVTTTGIAVPTKYVTPPAAPQGDVMILSAAGAELAAGAIPTANTTDVIQYRAEFVRSYF